MNADFNSHPSSFRDPCGRIFVRNGQLERRIMYLYKEHYDHLIDSGLYERLVRDLQLIPHSEKAVEKDINGPQVYKIVEPHLVPFISFPYEWCFSQLKDAAMLTLEIQEVSLSYGMSLKDASAYNIQFLNGKPILIDTLSFEKVGVSFSWVAAYRQFLRHFLAPLYLESYKDVRLNQLSRIYTDGVPLDLTSRLLPKFSYFNRGAFYHIHLSALLQRVLAGSKIDLRKSIQDKVELLDLVRKLRKIVKSLEWSPKNTEWADYYDQTNYSKEALSLKEKLVLNYLGRLKPGRMIDFGANTGRFSQLAGNSGFQVLALDIDPAAVEKNYLYCKKQNQTKVLPLVIDLTNPSASSGWMNRERASFLERASHSSTAMALALIHHLAISNNLPLREIAYFFQFLCCDLIIEFIPKEDSQVERLLARRVDIFPDYHQEAFETEFKVYFDIIDRQPIEGSRRFLYLMKKKNVLQSA